MIKLGARFHGRKLVAERGVLRYGALRYHRHTVHPGRCLLVKAVPVDGRTETLELVLHVHHDGVVLADVYRWSGHAPVDGEYAPLQPVRGDALRMETVRSVTETTVPAGTGVGGDT